MLASAQNSDLDRGATSVAAGMERTCALSRELKPVAEMIRFVIGPGGEVVADVKRKLPGRGIWITGTRAALEEAVKRNVFARGFKRDVRTADLTACVEPLLERAVLDALAILAKAGLAVAGFAKVEAALDQDDVVALIHAADAASDGTRKLDAVLHRKMAEKSREIPIITLLTGAQLDLALHRPNVVHAALLAGPGSETFLARAARLQRFRNSPAMATNVPSDGTRGQSSE
jgi:uncharacterized protein